MQNKHALFKSMCASHTSDFLLTLHRIEYYTGQWGNENKHTLEYLFQNIDWVKIAVVEAKKWRLHNLRRLDIHRILEIGNILDRLLLADIRGGIDEKILEERRVQTY